MNDVYILSAVRTPIGKFGGSLASITAADMGVVAAKAAIERAGVRPDQVEETIFGNARQAGGGPNPARQISIRSGVPQEVPAFTVNKACASGMKSIALAYQAILLVSQDCVLAGGTESMSRLPYYLEAPAGDTAWAIRNWLTACIAMDFSVPWRRWSWAKPPKCSPSSTRSLATNRTNLR